MVLLLVTTKLLGHSPTIVFSNFVALRLCALIFFNQSRVEYWLSWWWSVHFRPPNQKIQLVTDKNKFWLFRLSQLTQWSWLNVNWLSQLIIGLLYWVKPIFMGQNWFFWAQIVVFWAKQAMTIQFGLVNRQNKNSTAYRTDIETVFFFFFFF